MCAITILLLFLFFALQRVSTTATMRVRRHLRAKPDVEVRRIHLLLLLVVIHPTQVAGRFCIQRICHDGQCVRWLRATMRFEIFAYMGLERLYRRLPGGAAARRALLCLRRQTPRARRRPGPPRARAAAARWPRGGGGPPPRPAPTAKGVPPLPAMPQRRGHALRWQNGSAATTRAQARAPPARHAPPATARACRAAAALQASEAGSVARGVRLHR